MKQLTIALLILATFTAGAQQRIVIKAGGGGGGVNSSPAGNRLAYYPATGSTVAPMASLTPNRAVHFDVNGLPVPSLTTDVELNRLIGVTSNVQAQLNTLSGNVTAVQADIAAQTLLEQTVIEQTVTTTDATPATVYTLAAPSGGIQTYRVEVVCEAANSSGGGYGARKSRRFHYNGTTLSAGGLHVPEADEHIGAGLSTATFTISTSGTNVIIVWTGEAAKTIKANFTITITRANIAL